MPQTFRNKKSVGVSRIKLGNWYLPYKYVNQDLSEGITKINANFLCTVRQITVQRMSSQGRGSSGN